MLSAKELQSTWRPAWVELQPRVFPVYAISGKGNVRMAILLTRQTPFWPRSGVAKLRQRAGLLSIWYANRDWAVPRVDILGPATAQKGEPF
jgi:hypothetical protein